MPLPAKPRRRWWWLIILPLATAILLGGLVVAYRGARRVASEIVHRPANDALISWFNDPASRPALTTEFSAPCPGYPFLVPSAGLVGGLPWNAAYGVYNVLTPHPGIDIFGAGAPGPIPVYAA